MDNYITWRWGVQPEECIHADFETQSLVNIRKDGGRKYCQDPSTRISMCGFLKGEQRTMWVLPNVTPRGITVPDGWQLHIDSSLPTWVLSAIKNGAVLCWHNGADFDALIWNRLVKVPSAMTDSLPLCRAAGLPGSLDKACKMLFGEGKGQAYALINFLCTAKPRGESIVYPVATAAAWSSFISYCCKDVELLEQLYGHVYSYAESDILDVHQKVNDRGIPVDTALAARLVLLREELMLNRAQEFSEITEGELEPSDTRSSAKVTKWLHSLGISLPTVERRGKMVETLDKKELTRFLKEPDAFFEGTDNNALEAAIAALKLRFEVTGNAGGKALAIVKAADPDQRARGQEVYYGAHTGRWTARQLQPHNMFKGAKGVDAYALASHSSDLTFELIENAAKKANKTCSDVLSSLLRPCIYHQDGLSIGDFGSVEARGVAYLCDEKSELDEFSKWGADPYLPIASEIFGRKITKSDELERWVGKQAILGCGYSMSWRKFVTYCAVQGIELEKVGVDPKKVVDTYRRTHPNIAKAWRQLHDAMLLALDGTESFVCRCRIFKNNVGVNIQLPSRRCIVYRNARLEMQVPMYAKLFGIQCEKVPTFVFDHPHGYQGMSYGGRALENLTQAFCRDILGNRLVATERAGLFPVLHVHDEIVCQGRCSMRLAEIMSTPPDWCADFPLMVETFECDRYLKSAPVGAVHHAGLKGEVR